MCACNNNYYSDLETVVRFAYSENCLDICLYSKMRPNVGRAKVTHVGLFVANNIVLHEVNFSLDIGLRFLLYCMTSILYTDVQIF